MIVGWRRALKPRHRPIPESGPLKWWKVLLLCLVTLLPWLTGMAGLVYLGAAVLLGARFLRHAIALRRADAPAHLAMAVFRYSIRYLMLLFAALLVDHYVKIGV
jgi:protoheme IX farnesyltransferase